MWRWEALCVSNKKRFICIPVPTTARAAFSAWTNQTILSSSTCVGHFDGHGQKKEKCRWIWGIWFKMWQAFHGE